MKLVVVATVLGGSAIVSALIVALSIALAHRWQIYDHPDMERKSQDRPIPKLGGVAVALTFTVATVLALAVTGNSGLQLDALGILGPALAVAVLGFFDDRQHLNPYLRLAAQAVLAVVVWLAGTRLDLTGVPHLDLAIFVVWVMAVVNGINLLDNSDGLAGTTVLVSALGAGIIALMGGQELVSIMGFALAGAAVGFLWHNWHPAKVYLGDSGAYFLGFMLAVLVVRLRPEEAGPWQAALIAVLLVLLPLVDTAYVTVKRLRAGVHPFTAGRDHLSHVVQGRGATVPGSVVRLQILSSLSVAAAIGLMYAAL